MPGTLACAMRTVNAALLTPPVVIHRAHSARYGWVNGPASSDAVRHTRRQVQASRIIISFTGRLVPTLLTLADSHYLQILTEDQI